MAQKKPDGFMIYPEHVNVTRLLSDEERGQLLLALCEYAESAVLPSGKSVAFMTCFELMRCAIDRQFEKYRATCERNRMNIGKRWETQAGNSSTEYDCTQPNTAVYDRIPSVPMDTTHTNRTEQNRAEPNERVSRKRFTPPTLERVVAYCRERGNTVDAQRFVDFYASKGWKVGNQAMCDWKAAVRTWELRETQTPPPRREGVSRYADYESN